ncbi:MAG: triacylglycerol lipase [Nodularia sp. (in: Bacteria)]|nr:MAG: triacylglycerol lipase [Nodularia sp. (in: cyanobacteria)]
MNTKDQQRNSVLLVHGIGDTGAVFNTMASYLRQLGWSVYTLNLVPNNGEVGLDILAQQIADYVVNTFAPEQPIDLIGFSMGGIVSRYYVQRLGGINRVQRFVTISSPHHGTVIAYASQRHGCLQMRHNSQFIQDLNADAVMLEQLNFTSIWTPYDLMIVPANSSQMPLGKEVIVPVVLHSWMLTDVRSLAAVASALSEPVKPGHQFGYTDNCQKSLLGGGNI